MAFRLGDPWAVEIGQLREIVGWRDGMVRPPGLPCFVHGILNLRHQMISVIDLRRLLGMPPASDPTACKILIVERGAEQYGLIVDAVENIVTISAGERRPSPRLLAGDDGVRCHVPEVLDITGPDGAAETLNVFEPDTLFSLLERGMH